MSAVLRVAWKLVCSAGGNWKDPESHSETGWTTPQGTTHETMTTTLNFNNGYCSRLEQEKNNSLVGINISI